MVGSKAMSIEEFNRMRSSSQDSYKKLILSTTTHAKTELNIIEEEKRRFKESVEKNNHQCSV